MPNDITALFSPNSIAIIGASRSKHKVGGIVLQNLIESDYKGSIFAVNPNAQEIGGIICYKTIMDLPETPDLAVVAIPAALVLAALNELGSKGVKNVVILSAGFKEVGAEGAVLEKQVVDLCLKNNINLLGPNCLGFVNTTSNINATFAKVAMQKGNLRFVSQSGALATSLFDWFSSNNIGFSEFITLGNKAISNETDILQYFLQTSDITIETLIQNENVDMEPVGMYLESISDGQKFLKVCKQLAKKHPLYIIKPGRTKASAQAMQSHTGSIAGADDVLDTALNQAGVHRCADLEDFFDLSKALAWSQLPNGPRVAVISNAGGPAVISTDAIIAEDLELATFDETITKRLAEVLPRSASIIDPVDVLGDALAKRFADAAEIVLQSNACDALVIILTPQAMTQTVETAQIVGELCQKYKLPIFCSFIGGSSVAEAEAELNKLKVPAFHFPERAIATLGAMWNFKKTQAKLKTEITDIGVLNSQLLPEKSSEILTKAIQNNQQALDNLDANTIIDSSGIDTPPTKIATTLQDTKDFAGACGYPVVLKMSSPGLLHKKHLGGVILDIRNSEQLEAAWNTLERKSEHLEASIKEHVRFQVQKEIPSGTEIIVGFRRDPTFGPLVLFGAGGSLTELIADKNLHLLPIDLNGAKELVQKSKIYSVLQGNTNEPPQALDELYKLILNLSKLFESATQIHELEINPVIVSQNQVWAVDTKIILESSKPKPTGPKYKNATTTKVDLLAGKIRYFEFETEQPLNIEPGQYISIKVSPTRINCYSVAGQKSPTVFNLLVDSTPGGPGSKFFEALNVQDKISYLGPFGNFTLKLDDSAETLLFLGTGSGVAPLKSMIEYCLEKKVAQNIFLYVGLNNYEDIFMKDYFEKLSKEHANFKYKLVVCNNCDQWNGPTGFITEQLKNDFPDASKCAAYMCGNKFMITDATKILTDNGCSSERIYFEKL